MITAPIVEILRGRPPCSIGIDAPGLSDYPVHYNEMRRRPSLKSIQFQHAALQLVLGLYVAVYLPILLYGGEVRA